MTMQTRRSFVGLVTATGEVTAPEGALRIADNVVVRKAGVVEAREGMPVIAGEGNPTQNVAAYPYAGTTVYAAAENTAAGRHDVFNVVETRGNLYLAGPGKREAPGGSVKAVGLSPRDLTVTAATSGTTGVLATGQKVAYRVVLVHTDSNGVLRRSAPTSPVTVSNTSGSPTTVTLTLTPRVTLEAGTTAEVYRTRQFPVAITLDDEMQLAGSVTLGAQFVGIPFVDKTDDAARTTTLYTSPSREGIEGANLQPPTAAVIGLYRGAVFFGDIVSSYTLSFSHTWTDGLTTQAGVGSRLFSGNTTLGSPTITGIASTVGLEPGMVLTSPGMVVNPDAFTTFHNIVSVTASTVTMSANASATLAGSWRAHDAIQPENGAQWQRLGPHGQLGTSSFGYAFSWPASPLAGYAATYTYYGAGPVRATHGGEFMPPLATYGATPTAAQSPARDVLPGGIMWSNPDEPEHVPLTNAALVGDKNKRVLAFATTRDALFILKEDGVWRLSGTGGTYRIDPLDLTTSCVSPSSVRVLNNRVYALCNKGLCALDDGGVEIVARAVSDQIRTCVQLLRDGWAQYSGEYRYPEWAFNRMISAVDERSSEYLLLLPSGLEMGGHALVFNTETNACTTFSWPDLGPPSGLGVNQYGAPVAMFGGVVRARTGTVPTLSLPSWALLVGVRADQYLPNTVAYGTPNADGTVTAAEVLTTTPVRLGDLWVTATGAARVLGGMSGAWLLSAMVGTTGYFLRPVVSAVEMAGYTSPDVVGKLWTHVVFGLTKLTGAGTVRARFMSASPALTLSAQRIDEELPVVRVQGVSAHHAGALLRVNVPQAHRRAWLLRVGLEVQQPLGEMRLEAVSADSTQDTPDRTQSHATGAS